MEGEVVLNNLLKGGLFLDRSHVKFGSGVAIGHGRTVITNSHHLR